MSAEVVLVISPSTFVVIGRPTPSPSITRLHDEGQTKLLPIRGYRGGRGSASSRCAPAIFRGSDARLGIKDRGLYEVADAGRRYRVSEEYAGKGNGSAMTPSRF